MTAPVVAYFISTVSGPSYAIYLSTSTLLDDVFLSNAYVLPVNSLVSASASEALGSAKPTILTIVISNAASNLGMGMMQAMWGVAVAGFMINLCYDQVALKTCTSENANYFSITWMPKRVI
jgi:hypothetical protein